MPIKASTIQTWRSEKSHRTPNTCIYLTLKKASGIKYFYLLPKAWNIHGCFFYLLVNASTCLSNTKTHCVTKLRASTQRCACCVLELLCICIYIYIHTRMFWCSTKKSPICLWRRENSWCSHKAAISIAFPDVRHLCLNLLSL